MSWGHSFPTANLKKNAQAERCEFSFIWGPNEACSPGDSISDGSEKLLQRGGAPVGWGGEVRAHVILVKGGVHAIKHMFFCRFLLVTGAVLTMKNCSAFVDMKGCKNGAHKMFTGKYPTL